MKLTRRRATSTPDTDPGVDGTGATTVPDAQPEDEAPPGTVAAVYAEVLDGRRLWLAVAGRAGRPGRLAVRDRTGALLPLTDDDGHDDRPAGYLSARLDLTGLPSLDAGSAGGAGPATYDLVWVGSDDPWPLWAPPGAGRSETPVVADADGHPVRHTLVRGEGGRLRLRTVGAAAAVELLGVAVTGPESDRIELVLSPEVTTVLLVPEGEVDGDVLASLPVTDGRARLGATVAAAIGPRVADVAVEIAGSGDESGERLAVRRRAATLRDPGRGVPLPELTQTGDDPLLRLRWSGRGLLQVRVFGEAR